jgi:serine/threonine-protein kinase HipA
MTRKNNVLNVELYGTLLGTLTQGKNDFDFDVNKKIFEQFPLASSIMSFAVPLNPRITAPQQKKCRKYFAGMLPEGRNLSWLIQTLPQDERNTFGILKRYGKDGAGALMIYDPSDTYTSKAPTVGKVEPKKIRYLLEHMPEEPLGNSPFTGQITLGGVQGKILLVKKFTSWYRTHYGYPSTHILKPLVPEVPTMIYDEAFCMQLAHELGLTKYPVWIENFDGADALVIERYDRDPKIENKRLHQEDFCQALGAHGVEKYQEYGGKVSAKKIAGILNRHHKEGVKEFALQLLFGIAIGNLDMHAKNVSVLHYPDQTAVLAPTYDQVPLRHLGTDGKMALAIGGEYIHANMTIEHIKEEFLSWNTKLFSDKNETGSFVKNSLESFGSALLDAPAIKNAQPNLKKEILTFISNLLSGKRIG